MTTARTHTIEAYYYHRSLLLTATTREEYYTRAGALYAIARLLETLKTTGDGIHPLSPAQWVPEAAKVAQSVALRLSAPQYP